MEENKCRSGHDTKSSCTLWDVIASRQEIETNPRKVLYVCVWGGGWRVHTLFPPPSLSPLSVSSFSPSFVSNTLREWFLRKCVSASSALYSGSGLSGRVFKKVRRWLPGTCGTFFFLSNPKAQISEKAFSEILHIISSSCLPLTDRANRYINVSDYFTLEKQVSKPRSLTLPTWYDDWQGFLNLSELCPCQINSIMIYLSIPLKLLVSSQLDYCNCLLSSCILISEHSHPAARLVLRTREHYSLRSRVPVLNWLLSQAHVEY